MSKQASRRAPARGMRARRGAPLLLAAGSAAFLAACGASSHNPTTVVTGDAGGALGVTQPGVAQPGIAEPSVARSAAGASDIRPIAVVAEANAGASAWATTATLPGTAVARHDAPAQHRTRARAPAGDDNAAATAAAPKAIEQVSDAGKPGANLYKIGPQDLLEISVFKVQELSKSVQVAENGSINLPLLGEVQAAGQTARELEQQLTRSLGARYLQNPQVTVYVKEYNSQRVTLEGGGVKKPGVYPLKGKMTLLQLVATAEGLSDISNSEVAVFRQRSDKRGAVKYDVAAIRAGDAEDPELLAGDIVVAGTSATKEVFNNVVKAVPIATALRPF